MPTPVYLKDYAPPLFLIPKIDLDTGSATFGRK